MSNARPFRITARWFEGLVKIERVTTVYALNSCQALVMTEQRLPAHPSKLHRYSASTSH